MGAEDNKLTVSPYLGAKFSTIYNSGLYNQINGGVSGGIELNKGIFALNAEGTVGTALETDLKIGVKPEINKNWNYSAMAHVNLNQSLVEKKLICTNELAVEGFTPIKNTHIINYTPNKISFGARLGGEYHNDKLKIGFGIETGISQLGPNKSFSDEISLNNSSDKDISGNLTRTLSSQNGTTISEFEDTLTCPAKSSITKTYKNGFVSTLYPIITPYVEANYKVAKIGKNSLCIFGEATMQTGNAGVRVEF